MQSKLRRGLLVAPPNHLRCWLALASSGVCALALGGCTRDRDQRAPDEAVARLTASRGEVSHRRARSLTWRKAERDMALFLRDAVKTGPSASVTISFTAGSQLDLEERSLVVIELPEQPKTEKQRPVPVARIEQGTVRGVVRAGAPPLQIVGPDGKRAEIIAKGEGDVPFRIRTREAGTLEVAVLSGTAEVRLASGEAATVRTNHAVDVQKGSLSRPIELLRYPDLLSPDVDAKVDEKPELRWQPVSGTYAYRVQVSRRVDFGSRLVDRETPATHFRLSGLESGQTYVWRVSSVDEEGREGEFGFARRFSVPPALKGRLGPGPPRETAAPPPADKPTLVGPINNAGYEYVREPPPVIFSWRKTKTARRYELVVAKRRDLRQAVVIRRQLQDTRYRAADLAPGTYYWGVYAVDDAGKKRPLFDKSRRLVITKRQPPKLRVPRAIDWR